MVLDNCSGIVSETGITNVTGKIKIEGKNSCQGMVSNISKINIKEQTQINMIFSGNNSIGMYGYGGDFDIKTNTLINIKLSGEDSVGFFIFDGSFEADGNIYIQSDKVSSGGFSIRSSNLTLQENTRIFFDCAIGIFSNKNSNNQILQGARIAFEKEGTSHWYEVKEKYTSSDDISIGADNISTLLKTAATSSWQTAADIITEEKAETEEKSTEEKQNLQAYQNQYNNALSQFDMLINDSSYKGVNLLKEDSLKVNFNEDKSANLQIEGMDVSSKSLGVLTADWTTTKDVQNSMNQVLAAKEKLRAAATKLGNYYSIITERENFTDNLINVLTEGADKLTLADMNEESANMLSLQTRQSLAINSLSLASQASQAILKLF